jgi:uncharacterized protein YdhG (YjbR/CyaY superfamily)
MLAGGARVGTVRCGEELPHGRAEVPDLSSGRSDRQVRAVANEPTVSSIDEYIAGFPPETQAMLEQLRALIKAAAPGVTETISYGMPTFDLDGQHVVHFAGWKAHIGFYPVPGNSPEILEGLKPYKTSKGTAQYPLDRPLPAELISRIVEYRVDQVAGKDLGQ